MRTRLLIVVVVVALIGCAVGLTWYITRKSELEKRYDAITIGISREKVVTLLGDATYDMEVPQAEGFLWWSDEDHYIIVVLSEGKVVRKTFETKRGYF